MIRPLVGVTLAALSVTSLGSDIFFTGVGDLPGGSYYSEAHAVSADGSTVVGMSKHASQFEREAFRWTLATGMVGLGALPGLDPVSWANGVSGDGSVVVGDGAGGAWRWTQQEGMIALGDLGSDSWSGASGVSADGRVVVGHARTTEYLIEAFRWTQAAGMVGLGFLPGGSFSGASAASTDGAVIVGVGWSAQYPKGEAFRWENWQMVGLGALPGDDHSVGYAVGADGAVVVGTSDSAYSFRAFRWTAAGGMLDLGGNGAVAVSGDGSIVVGRFAGTPALWFDGGWHDLRDLLVNEYHLDLSAWYLERATAISADGKTIVGWGYHYGYGPEGWVAHIPEPGTAALVLLCVLMGRAPFGRAEK